MKDESVQDIETTYGQIRIFKDIENNQNRNYRRKRLTKSEQDTIVNQNKIENEASESKQPITENKNEDYFGFDLSGMNYFDKNVLNQYKLSQEAEKKESDRISNNYPSSKNNSSSYILDEDGLNTFDEQYFKSSKNTQTSGKKKVEPAYFVETETSIEKYDVPKSTSKLDLEKFDDLNYIDKQIFSPNSEHDSSIGSIRDFKNEQKRRDKLKKVVAEKIPIVQSTNITEDDSNLRNFQLKKKVSGEAQQQASSSQHKLLHSEVPNWFGMTFDEAATILKSHICYHDEERKYTIIKLTTI